MFNYLPFCSGASYNIYSAISFLSFSRFPTGSHGYCKQSSKVGDNVKDGQLHV